MRRKKKCRVELVSSRFSLSRFFFCSFFSPIQSISDSPPPPTPFFCKRKKESEKKTNKNEERKTKKVKKTQMFNDFTEKKVK